MKETEPSVVNTQAQSRETAKVKSLSTMKSQHAKTQPVDTQHVTSKKARTQHVSTPRSTQPVIREQSVCKPQQLSQQETTTMLELDEIDMTTSYLVKYSDSASTKAMEKRGKYGISRCFMLILVIFSCLYH